MASFQGASNLLLTLLKSNPTKSSPTSPSRKQRPGMIKGLLLIRERRPHQASVNLSIQYEIPSKPTKMIVGNNLAKTPKVVFIFPTYFGCF
uniref:Uncharacterized protein n=1 Tax=Oryza meridionalis TaxID=40149 RepID=A0A0E0E856_9ORYZ